MNNRTERCDGCYWWHQFNDYGHCKARAPVMGGQFLSGHIGDWPITGGNDFCGDFKPNDVEEKR